MMSLPTRVERLERVLRELLVLFEACWTGEGASSTAFENLSAVQTARRMLRE